jgi:hypothetical protein
MESEDLKEVEGVSRSQRVRKTKINFLDALDSGSGYDSGSNFGSNFESNGNPKKRKRKSTGSFSKSMRQDDLKHDYSSLMPLSGPPIVKRPRGRPPLSAKKNPIFPSSYFPPPTTTSSSNKPPPSSLKGFDSDTIPVKYPRPQYDYVVKKVTDKLMISDPISLNDLAKKLIDCPRDMIHAVLEVLQVLGIVIQLKAKEGLREYPSGTVVYTLLEFAKAPKSIPLQDIEENLQELIMKEEKIQQRNQRIHVRRIF